MQSIVQAIIVAGRIQGYQVPFLVAALQAVDAREAGLPFEQTATAFVLCEMHDALTVEFLVSAPGAAGDILPV